MGDTVRFKDGTEAQILALLPTDIKWVNKAFYYPIDKDYFYRIVDGVMKLYGGGQSLGGGTGVKLNGKVLGGIKTFIESADLLDIPENHDYNTFNLKVEGVVKNNGIIRIQ